MTTSRLPHGLTTTTRGTDLGMYILPDPTKANQYFSDFNNFVLSSWNSDLGGTIAVGDQDGGVLLFTTTAGDGNTDNLFQTGRSFLIEPGKKAWYSIRYKLSSAANLTTVFGLATAKALSPTDGIYFESDDENPIINFIIRKNNVSVVTEITTGVDDTYLTLGFYYAGGSSIKVFLNNEPVVDVPAANIPDDETLGLTFHVNNGTTGSKVATVDYVFVAKER